jgi:hypothetical protein
MSKSVSTQLNLIQFANISENYSAIAAFNSNYKTDWFLKLAYKHYVRALSRWPKDNLRPECQFQDAMKKRLDRRFLPASSPDTAKAAQAVTNSAIDEKMELEQANALYSLLENRYTQTVC